MEKNTDSEMDYQDKIKAMQDEAIATFEYFFEIRDFYENIFIAIKMQ